MLPLYDSAHSGCEHRADCWPFLPAHLITPQEVVIPLILLAVMISLNPFLVTTLPPHLDGSRALFWREAKGWRGKGWESGKNCRAEVECRRRLIRIAMLFRHHRRLLSFAVSHAYPLQSLRKYICFKYFCKTLSCIWISSLERNPSWANNDSEVLRMFMCSSYPMYPAYQSRSLGLCSTRALLTLPNILDVMVDGEGARSIIIFGVYWFSPNIHIANIFSRSERARCTIYANEKRRRRVMEAGTI